ncbi:MAG: YlbF family regulator, partial [Natronomonas sp.]
MSVSGRPLRLQFENSTMSVETKPTDRVEDLASELGEAIAESDTYQRFKAATSAVEADETAQQQIEAFE